MMRPPAIGTTASQGPSGVSAGRYGRGAESQEEEQVGTQRDQRQEPLGEQRAHDAETDGQQREPEDAPRHREVAELVVPRNLMVNLVTSLLVNPILNGLIARRLPR